MNRLIPLLLFLILAGYQKTKAQCPVAPQPIIVVSIEGNQPVIKLLNYQPGSQYRLYRSAASASTFTQVTSFLTPSYIDADKSITSAKEPYCYYVIAVNLCGNVSQQSATVCGIYLSGQENELSWTAPVQISSVRVTYRLYQTTNLSTPVVGPIQTTNATVQDTREQTVYRVEAILTWVVNGITYIQKIYSNDFFFKKFAINIPTAFTPNNDNINDKLIIFAGDLSGFQLSIFNRWGELVFYSDNQQTAWDGNLPDGTAAPVGMYTLLLKYADSKNPPQEWRQPIQLIR